MKYLVAVFVCMAVYGYTTGHYGGAILSAFMAVFSVYGSRQLSKRDAEAAANQTAVGMDSLECLDAQCCECSRTQF